MVTPKIYSFLEWQLTIQRYWHTFVFTFQDSCNTTGVQSGHARLCRIKQNVVVECAFRQQFKNILPTDYSQMLQ